MTATCSTRRAVSRLEPMADRLCACRPDGICRRVRLMMPRSPSLDKLHRAGCNLRGNGARLDREDRGTQEKGREEPRLRLADDDLDCRCDARAGVGVERVAGLRDGVPTDVTAVMITTAINAAIRPYSMAVTPDSSLAKRVNRVFMSVILGSRFKQRPVGTWGTVLVWSGSRFWGTGLTYIHELHQPQHRFKDF
jgi:hypothetical protein